MTLNLLFPHDPQGGKGNYRPTQNPVTLKVRAVRVLRAYINAPGGCGVEAVFRTLTTLEPVPTYREAVQLTEKLPSQVGGRALTRFFAFLQAVERIEAQRVDAQAMGGHKSAQALVTPDRTQGPDWVPVREGRGE